MNQCFMSVDWVAFVWRFFVTNPSAVVLSVWIGVDGCLWTIYSTAIRGGITCRKLIYSAPISASGAEVIRFLWFVQWSRLLHCLLRLICCLKWRNIHQLSPLLSVWSGRMHGCVLLGPCCSLCRTGWHHGVNLSSLGSTLLCPLLLLLLLLGLMIFRWELP